MIFEYLTIDFNFLAAKIVPLPDLRNPTNVVFSIFIDLQLDENTVEPEK